MCHDFPVPATPISISRSFILLRFFILVIGFILKYLWETQGLNLKIKCPDFKSNLLFASIRKKLWSNVNKTVFWVKRKVHLQFTQPLKHFLKIWFSNCNYSAFCKSLDLLMLTLQSLNIKQHFIENKYLKPRYTHKS